MGQAAETVQLKQDTLLAYAEHIREAEAAMERTLRADDPFLWSDGCAERTRQAGSGLTIAELWSGKRPIKVPDGLIHDWIGATRIGGTTIEKALALVQDYDNHKNVYKPEVIDSKLISRHGDDFQIYLRLLKKKIITVVLDTDHDVHYSRVDSTRACCRSSTTRIAEVEDAGKPTERARPPDTGYGFLWRLNSYWRFLERDGSVYVECRAISLTRNVPKGLGWMIEPIVEKLPRESLRATLEATRRALSSNPG
ncbi:conserved hypothetical protein [Candidatus Sulfopaludibacter sp. SbA6]|nr:conserved hypothetical protein [Candidatus Sulfopaludibacter sp. SbA6]